MSAQELLAEIQKLPVEEQRRLLEALSLGIRQQSIREQPANEDEVDRVLFEKGIIGEIPGATEYTDEDDDFEPVEIIGKPISETIIEDRR